MEIHDPGNEAPIDRLYAYLSVDAAGNHGLIASMLPGIGASPLVCASRRVAALMQPFAEEAARATGRRAALFVFVRGEKLLEFDPRH